MSQQAWKNKLKEAKKFLKNTYELEDEAFEARAHEAIANNDQAALDQVHAEQQAALAARKFKVDGKRKKKDITDPELLQKFKKANVNKRKGRYTWAEGGREAAKDMRVSKKKNMASPVGTEGALATVSRDLNRWEMGYGTEVSLKKGSVVMPISEPYIFHEKKCITVMSGPNVFKGVPVAVLRPVDDD